MRELERLTEHVWILPFEEERDRPNLCYICGDRWSLAVDAGHSAGHTEDFYRSLEASNLPLPDITVITHWHWDHTLGIHAVHGHCIANERTNQYLRKLRKEIEQDGRTSFLSMDPSIRREYDGGRPVIVELADMVFQGELILELGNCPVRVFEAEAPHTDDSTLVNVIRDKVLILGDANYGVFPEWTMDPRLAGKLAETIRDVNPKVCVHGHSEPVSAKSIIRDLSV